MGPGWGPTPNVSYAPVTPFLLTPNILLIALLLPFPYVQTLSELLLFPISCIQIFFSCYYLPLNSKNSPHRIVTSFPLCPNALHARVISYLLHANILRTKFSGTFH
jgi:hypothetical protein